MDKSSLQMKLILNCPRCDWTGQIETRIATGQRCPECGTAIRIPGGAQKRKKKGPARSKIDPTTLYVLYGIALFVFVCFTMVVRSLLHGRFNGNPIGNQEVAAENSDAQRIAEFNVNGISKVATPLPEHCKDVPGEDIIIELDNFKLGWKQLDGNEVFTFNAKYNNIKEVQKSRMAFLIIEADGARYFADLGVLRFAVSAPTPVALTLKDIPAGTVKKLTIWIESADMGVNFRGRKLSRPITFSR